MRKKILIILPYDMSTRNFLHGDLVKELKKNKNLHITWVTRHPRDKAAIPPGMRWGPIIRPGKTGYFWADMRFTIGFYLHLLLVYRFNAIHNFTGFQNRLRQSLPLRWRAFKEGLPSLKILGFPFPRNLKLFQTLHNFYTMGWQRHPTAEKLLDQISPDLVVVTHLQNHFVLPYVLAAQKRHIKILGINGSWDQPTTKGPLVPGLDHILTQSPQTKNELQQFHAIPARKISVVGWPQMDIFAKPKITPRTKFLKQLKLKPTDRYILVGLYGARLGQQEPEICEMLAQKIDAGDFGANIKLYLRPHPLEIEWKKRFGFLQKYKCVVIEPPQLGNLPHLSNLIKHAAMVVASAGTIHIDATALNTPSIALAIEDENVPYYDRVARYYDMEHYAAILKTGAIDLVNSTDQLEHAIRKYLKNPDRNTAGRKKLRDEFLNGLNGHASEKIALHIKDFLQ